MFASGEVEDDIFTRLFSGGCEVNVDDLIEAAFEKEDGDILPKIEFIDLEKESDEIRSKIQMLSAKRYEMDRTYLTDLEFENFVNLLIQIDGILSAMIPIFKEREERWSYTKCKTTIAFQSFYSRVSRFKAQVVVTITGIPVFAQVNPLSKHVVAVKGYNKTYWDFVRFRVDFMGCCEDVPRIWRRRFKVKPRDGKKNPEHYGQKVETAIDLYSKLYSSIHCMEKNITK